MTIGKNATPSAIVLDTGGGTSAFDPEVVTAAGIKLGQPIRAMGAGGETREAWLLGDVSYSLPGVTLEGQSITAISFRHLEETTGRRMDGVLGSDFLRQFVVIIDYEGRKLHLHDPKSYQYEGDGHPLPLKFGGPIPTVKATLNGTIDAEFMVDTGARMGVKASRMFVERAKLDDAANAVIEGGPGYGIGGATAQGVARFDKFSVAGFDLPSPLVFLSRDSAGVFGKGESDGVLGGDVWRRFTVILDYPNKMMYLEPNASFNDLFEYDMSGLALRMDNESKGGFLVSAVLSNSPAEAAGMQVGDRIEAVDDKPVASMVLEDIRESFREAGRTVQVTRRRGDAVSVVTLTLKRLI
ncbi:MAG TPA: aspartyl protease family protein [Candidatus Eisenbacteria bacterium]